MSKLLISEPPIQVLPTLALTIGLNEAMILQQLHYWLENSKAGGCEHDGYKWIFNTYEEWQDNFPFWSVNTIQRTFASLEEMGLVISAQLSKNKYDRKKYYRIDYTVLDQLEMLSKPQKMNHRSHQNGMMEEPTLGCSLNESENTAENTIDIAPDGASETLTVEPLKPVKRPLPDREPGGTDAKRKGDILDAMMASAAKQIDTIDLSWLDESLRPRALAFWQGSGIAPMPDERNYWRKELKSQYDAGITPDQIKRACTKMRADGLTIKSPASIRAIAKDLPNQLAPRPPSELPPMTQSTRPPAAAYELLARLKAQSEPNPQETIHELPQM